ncbi:MAG TPA: prefoldin subunit beta [Candidatus Diapherotrites archaeon]|uniref:Prefoldin subunit n=1 Tax=Candidatus Iainarchaeum sp. TaxID=3101447 RepID=A0A7J4JLF2_9ARCH|nr:prefoldin subunit [Candidatus Diapherotrites archaeon]HIH16086.1 prefoldin subunit beta [Candidatus Diapherotrites archaeon]
MAEQNIQQNVTEFERNRAQLMGITNQKQQLQLQANALNAALSELKNSKEKKVYKAVGNILILSDAKKVEKEIGEQKESAEVRVKSLQKQEAALVDKLTKLKSLIERSGATGAGETGREKKAEGM